MNRGVNNFGNKPFLLAVIGIIVVFLCLINFMPTGNKETKAAGITKYARAAGGNWNAAATWSTTSGGPADTTVPTIEDDVILDAASGPVTINATANAKSFTASSYSGTLTHNASITLTVNGSVTFSSAMTYSKTATSTIWMGGTTIYTNLTTAGKELGALTVYAHVTLQDDVTMTGQLYRASVEIIPNGKRITFNGSGSVAGGGITFYQLYVTGADSATASFTFGGNHTITNEFRCTGFDAGAKRLKVGSNTTGTARTLTVTGATMTGSNNVNFYDIVFARTTSGGLDLTNGGANSIGDVGGNSRTGGDGTVTFTTPVTQTWTNAAGGNWSTASNWTSRVPLPQDNVIMNIGSAYNSGVTISADMTPLGKDIDWTGATWTGTAPIFQLGIDTGNYGSVTLISGLTLNPNSKAFWLSGRGTHTVTSAGATWYTLWLSSIGGSYTLTDSLLASSFFSTQAGILNTNGNAITCSSVSYGNTTPLAAVTLNLGSSLITLTGSGTLWDQPNRTVNAGTSTIYFSYTGATATSFTGRSATFYDILIAPGSNILTFSTAMSFRNLTMSSSGTKTISFTRDITYTMTGTSFLSGSSGNYITLSSAGTGAQPIINNTSGSRVASDYLKVIGVNVTPASTWFPGLHSYANLGLLFNGSSGYVTIPNSATANQFKDSTAYSVEAWVFAAGAGENNGGRIFDKRAATTTGILGMINSTPLFATYADYSGGSGVSALSATSSYSVHHVAIVWTGSQIRTYVDGVAGTATGTSGTPLDDSALSFLIGNRSADDRTFNGMIHSLRVYRNKGLSQSDITTLYSAGVKASAPVSGATAEYLFNEGSGSTLTDGINGVNGTITTAIWSNTGWAADSTPPTNPTTASATLNGTSVSSGSWTGSSYSPVITFSGALDDGGSGVKGYYTYWGTSSTGDPITYQAHSGSDQSYTASGNTDGAHYYFRVKTVDQYDNVSTATTLFELNFDRTAPTRPSFISSDPAGYTTTNSFQFSWPAGSDPNGAGGGASGMNYYEYKRATDAEWTQTASLDARSVSGVQAYQEGANAFYVRLVDNVLNISDYQQVTFYYSGSAPAKPSNLHVTPESSDANEFTLIWNKPAVGLEDPPIVGYYYSINAYPTIANVTYVGSESDEVSVGHSPFATQQGTNTVYVLSVNAAGNLSFESAYVASATFSCVTAALPTPTDVSLTDSSNRAYETWGLTLKWVAGEGQDSGAFDHYSIERSTNGADFSALSTSTGTAFIDINNLNDSTTYYYRVKAVDSAGKESAPSSIVHKMPVGNYLTPPTYLSQPEVSAVKANGATISWATNRGSSSVVRYGRSLGEFEASSGQLDELTDHSVVLLGLYPSTTYYFQVQSLDEFRDYEDASAFSDTYSFVTSPAPAISETTVKNITLTSADISFETTTVSNSTIFYGETTSFDNQINDVSGASTTNHNVKLASLKAGTTYYFQIRGIDVDNNLIISDNYQFDTLPLPKIENLKIQSIPGKPQSAFTATWTTNVPTTSVLKYKTGSDPYKESVKSKSETAHSVEINDLSDDSNYQIIASGRDAIGNLVESSVINFATPLDTRPPNISNLQVETSNVGSGNKNRSQVVIFWKTDEPTTSQVEYGPGSDDNFNNLTTEDSVMTTEHSVIISDLNPSQVYHFRAISKDKAANVSKSDNQTFISGSANKSVWDLIMTTLSGIFGFIKL